ncbi:MAG: DNA polymerase III subunit alpha [Alphaproteobacteria bacterium 43-37]|nr:MAG: DNA polymerase III subunit alpha [Alphaproteobacteria bacterium 43-37]
MPEFVHLKTHSAYSLAEGAIKTTRLVDLCVEHGMPAVALTDSGNLFGALEFSLACAEKGIQGIIGLKLKFKDILPNGQTYFYHMGLLAQSQDGYNSLMKLASNAYINSKEHEAPCIDAAAIDEWNKGLILLSGSLEGPVHMALLQKQVDTAVALTRRYKAIFGDRFYLEISRCGYPDEARIEEALLTIAMDEGVPIVATNEVYFESPQLHEAHDILLCISQGVTVSVENRRKVSSEHYFKSQSAMKKVFSDLPEAIENTIRIARRCHFMPRVSKPILPPFPTTDGKSEAEELVIQANDGLTKRLERQVFKPVMDEQEKVIIRENYQERLNYELDIIIKMGFPGYFLIVSDFIRWAKQKGIPVGPGRGSGAGSLVAWVLTITDIDPIAFNLLFERFLNPERVSLPDFDVDFCQDRRDEVIEYVREKYGDNKVAHIITFGKLQARAVLRDVGRVLEMPYGYVDKICKLIPNNPANPVTLEQALDIDPQLRSMMREDPDVAKLINNGLKLEGLYRHASTHAAGVVIGGRPLDELVPLYKDARSPIPATQFNMKYVEQAGLLKFDFLGLKTLTVIDKTCQLIGSVSGNVLDISTIPIDDTKTFELLNRVETAGVFQLESGGMRDVLRRLKPDRLEELIALVALYRPGPMDDIPRYLACKHGEEPVQYSHPMLEPILKDSFGVMVVQEQVMQIAQVMAGYTLGGADLLRRAMGKKNREEMDSQRAKFIEGALGNGVSENIASAVFDQISKFAGYGFNKSHAAPYALLTYQTAYLKANYPVEFLCASMTLDMGNADKINLFKQELRRIGIPLLGPDINKSVANFSIEFMPDGQKAIRYGLGAIKNVGYQAMQDMSAARSLNGPFSDVFDFVERVDSKALNKRQMESLVLAGGFDSLHKNRHSMWSSLDVLTSVKKETDRPPSLFGAEAYKPKQSLSPVPEWGLLERLQKEFDVLGSYFSAHPLEGYPLHKLNVVHSNEFYEALLSGVPTLNAVGVMVSSKERVSKNGQRYAFIQMSDAYGQYEVVLFSEILSKTRELLVAGQSFVMTLAGRIEADQVRLTAQSIDWLENKMADHPVEVAIYDPLKLEAIKRFCEQLQPGEASIIVRLPLEEGEVELRLPQKYQLSFEQRSNLLQLAAQ